MAFPLHVKLIGAEDGRRYALPDVGGAPEYASEPFRHRCDRFKAVQGSESRI